MSVPWWDARMVSLDLETTSADPELARIVQAAVVLCGGGEPVVEWSRIVNPGVEIPEEAAAIHGISTERARAEGIAPTEALEVILGLLAQAPTGAVVVFNARYDLTVCDREIRRHESQLSPLDLLRLVDGRVFDPLIVDRHLDKYRAGKRTLGSMIPVWRVPVGRTHDATFDALCAARVAWRIGKAGRVVRRTRDEQEARDLVRLTHEWEAVRGDLAALFVWQRQLAAEYAEQLERYFHEGNPSKGVPPQPGRRVERDWPLLPLGVLA